MVNATGWDQLIQGKIIEAPFYMFNIAWGGWFIALLYFIFQLMLYLKTRNALMGFIIGIFFVSIYAGSTVFSTGTFGFIHVKSMQAITLMLIIQLAGTLYVLIWK